MACFLVPAGEAVVVTVAVRLLAAKEKQAALPCVQSTHREKKGGIALSRKLNWLSGLLWGGCALLAFEHLWHGEIVPFFPFLTAMGDPAETVTMLQELASVGGTMAVWITAVWAVMAFAADAIVRRPAKRAVLPEV